MGIKIDHIDEINVLHRAIMEAKFSGELLDKAIVGSPALARLSHRIVEELIASDDSIHQLSNWDSWRKIDQSRREWNAALNCIEPTVWGAWEDSQKREYAKLLVSPLVFVGESLVEFIAAADNL